MSESQPADYSTDIRRVALIVAMSEICLTLCAYRILWFFNKKYRPKHVHNTQLPDRDQYGFFTKSRALSRNQPKEPSRGGSIDDLSREGSRENVLVSSDGQAHSRESSRGHVMHANPAEASTKVEDLDDEVALPVDEDNLGLISPVMQVTLEQINVSMEADKAAPE